MGMAEMHEGGLVMAMVMVRVTVMIKTDADGGGDSGGNDPEARGGICKKSATSYKRCSSCCGLCHSGGIIIAGILTEQNPGDDVVDDDGGGGGDGDSCGDTGNSSLCVEPGVEGVTHLVGEPWTPSQFSCARSCFITLVFFLQFVNNTYKQKMIIF